MSKWTMFWIGAFLSASVSFGAFRGPDLYHRFSPNGYQTFAVKIPNQFLQNGVMPPQNIAALTQTFNKTMVFAIARAIEMKDISSLKKLDIFFGFFDQYDDERYEEWRKKHPKHF